MNCSVCHHTHHIHESTEQSGKTYSSILLVGKCLVPDCGCTQYGDKIEMIDEDLL